MQERIMDKESFKVAVPDAVLSDLRDRLSRVRYPIDFANENWSYGTNRAYLEELVAYWRDQHDWRKHEAEINRFAHCRTMIDGVPIHFIHEPGKGPKRLPLILSHGWPLDLLGFAEGDTAAGRPGCLRRRRGRRLRCSRTFASGILLFDSADQARHQLVAHG
jgi:hypothetical protein